MKKILFATLLSTCVIAQEATLHATQTNSDLSQLLFKGFKYRFVGPLRGGRVNAVVGHPTEKTVFYAGYTGGGVWKTEDGGNNWMNLSDGQIKKGSIGAIDISRSDPSVLFVGTGEHAYRGDVSHGDGAYKSIDGGKTWTHVGLKDTRQIARVLIHPKNPDVVYVAAIGHFAGPNKERGVFRTTDGGKTWEQVLFQDENSGAIDLEMDMTKPDVLFAATWDFHRYPWGVRSGGTGSRIYRSMDGGDHWEEITKNSGLPRAKVRERIGLALSESKPGRVWTLISSDAGRGLFRSEDYGETWTKMTEDIRLFARVYYYMHIVADPQDADRVYVPGEYFFVSKDGGKHFDVVPTQHYDHQDLWIDPTDNRRMIDGSDGGAQISFNQCKSWSTLFNQPTAQIYTLTVDNRFPYYLYGSQQDWGSVAVSSRPRFKELAGGDEYETANSEGGYTAVRPDNHNILYVGDHHWMFRSDLESGYHQYITPRDDNYYGWGTADIEHRIFWTFPILLSPHNPNVLYMGSQYVLKTTNEGDTWETISPDLTLADPKTMELTPFYGRDISANGPYWGPLTRDSNGDNWYATIYTIAESPLKEGLIWTGSDDGLVYVTLNDGKKWRNVTPKNLPECTLVSRIEPSPFDPGTAYFAATRYKVDDLGIYLYKTTNYGKGWKAITKGIDKEDFVRVVRADPVRRDLLFAGSETGIYVSFDDGSNWQRIQQNLPHVPVYDMKIKKGDLAIATHGRGFWILDDLSLLRQWDEKQVHENVHLYKPRSTVRYRGRSGKRYNEQGRNEQICVELEIPRC